MYVNFQTYFWDAPLMSSNPRYHHLIMRYFRNDFAGIIFRVLLQPQSWMIQELKEVMQKFDTDSMGMQLRTKHKQVKGNQDGVNLLECMVKHCNHSGTKVFLTSDDIGNVQNMLKHSGKMGHVSFVLYEPITTRAKELLTTPSKKSIIDIFVGAQFDTV